MTTPRGGQNLKMTTLTLPPELADQYAKAKQSIANGGPQKIKTLAVVSATRFEGTTTVAAQLAISLAPDPKLPVLLVDANFRNPDLHRRFQVPQEGGLSNLLCGEGDFEALLKVTPTKNVFLMTSGKDVLDPAEFIKMADLEDKLIRPAVNFSYIVIDCPPVNTCPEAIMLASHSDGAVLVVQAGETRREVVLEARQRLAHAKVNLLGAVLNKRKYHIPEFVYGKL
ncbi:MAG TPA: CpsD/CapB family tyrosine-protein kinase [Candidatus Binatia bacterium]